MSENAIKDPRADLALRKDLEKFTQKIRAKSKSTITGTRNPEKTENGIIKPEYEIKHSKNLRMQEYVGTGQGIVFVTQGAYVI